MPQELQGILNGWSWVMVHTCVKPNKVSWVTGLRMEFSVRYLQHMSMIDSHLLCILHPYVMPCHVYLYDQRLFLDVKAPWQNMTLGHHTHLCIPGNITCNSGQHLAHRDLGVHCTCFFCDFAQSEQTFTFSTKFMDINTHTHTHTQRF